MFKISPYNNIHRNNNRNIVLNGIKSEMVIFALDYFKFIFSAKKRFLRKCVASNRVSNIQFLYFKGARQLIEFGVFKIVKSLT